VKKQSSNLRYLPPILFAVVLTVLYRFIGFYFETNDDPQFELMFRGIIFPHPLTATGFWHFGTASVLAWCYETIPSLPWYGMLMVLLIYCFIYNVYLLALLIGTSVRRFWLFTGMIAFVVFIAFNSIILVNFTRVAMLSGGSALLVLLFYNGSPLSFLFRFIQWAIFVTALLVRPESVILSAGLLLPLGIIAAILKKNGHHLLIYTGVPALAMILLVKGYAWLGPNHSIQTDQRIRNLSVLINYEKTSESLFGMDEKSAAIQNAVFNWFIWDKEGISDDLLLQWLSNNNKEGLTAIASEALDHIRHQLFLLAKNNTPTLAVHFALFLIFLIGWRDIRKIDFALMYTGFHAAFWITTLFIAITMKMPNRVFEPMLIVYTLGHGCLIYVLFGTFPHIPRIVSSLILFAALGSILIFIYRGYGKVQWYQKREAMNRAMASEIDQRFMNKTIAVMSPGLHLLTGATQVFRKVQFIRWSQAGQPGIRLFTIRSSGFAVRGQQKHFLNTLPTITEKSYLCLRINIMK
jgi:hypothetical protein